MVATQRSNTVGVHRNTQRRNTDWECTGAGKKMPNGTHRETHWSREDGNWLKCGGRNSGDARMDAGRNAWSL